MTFFDKVTDIAKNIGNKATGIAKNIGDKASEVVETSKLHTKIAAERETIAETQRKLGEYYYAQHPSQEGMDAQMKEYFDTIDKSLAEIKAYEEEIDQQREQYSREHPDAGEKPELLPIVCPKCGTVNAPDSAFCKNCGTALTPNPAQKAEAEAEHVDEETTVEPGVPAAPEHTDEVTMESGEAQDAQEDK